MNRFLPNFDQPFCVKVFHSANQIVFGLRRWQASLRQTKVQLFVRGKNLIDHHLNSCPSFNLCFGFLPTREVPLEEIRYRRSRGRVRLAQIREPEVSVISIKNPFRAISVMTALCLTGGILPISLL